jgi:hypothetical protein
MTPTETPAPLQPSDGKRQSSSIEFPYADLEQVKKVAEAVRDVGGTSCDVEQLAAKLGQPSTSGTFKLRVFAAKTFGLIKSERGTITLRELGSRICDPDQSKAAGVEAFLNVPLYKAIYEQFKTVPLPGIEGLEGAIVNLGVVPKQKATARQVFQRSAKQAGFFDLAPNKLVMPVIGTPQQSQASQPPAKNNNGGGGQRAPHESDGSIHPFIQGLLATLPSPDTEWETDARKRWLQAAAGIFDLMYKTKDGNLIVVECKNSAK